MRVLERVADFINPVSDRINLHDLAERRLIFHRKTLQRYQFFICTFIWLSQKYLQGRNHFSHKIGGKYSVSAIAFAL